MAAVAMTYYPAAAYDFNPPLIAHDNHFLGDISSSEKNDPEKPISAGIYVFKPGSELEYAYNYDEMKIILEGSATLRDATGQKVKVCFVREFCAVPMRCSFPLGGVMLCFDWALRTDDRLMQVKAGDVFYFPKGSVITFKTDEHCKAFFCGQRKQGSA